MCYESPEGTYNFIFILFSKTKIKLLKKNLSCFFLQNKDKIVEKKIYLAFFTKSQIFFSKTIKKIFFDFRRIRNYTILDSKFSFQCVQ